jgi:hypothetical protein
MKRPGGRLGMYMYLLEAADEIHRIIGVRRQQPARKMIHRLRAVSFVSPLWTEELT